MTDTNRTVIRHDFHLPRLADEAFALFDPISERDWVPGWEPLSIYPPELSLEEGSVFTLERDHGSEIWTVLRHDTTARRADYLTTIPGFQQRWIRVRCEAEGSGCRVFIEYHVTALSETGRDAFTDFGPDALRAWEAPVAAALGIAPAA